MSLPKVVYIYEDEDTDGTKFMVASKEPGELDEGIIGVYDLRETLNVRHKLQFRRPKTKMWFDSHK